MLARFRFALLVLATLAANVASAQRVGWFLSGFSGQSTLILGSQDSRVARGVGIGYNSGFHPRLRWGRRQGELQSEFYYGLSTSEGVGTRFPSDSTSAFGLLTYARYKWHPKNAPASFLDLGWGLQFQGQATHDLPSKINSTPVVDFGIILGKEHERALIGARFMHISNGHALENNDGQNQFYFLIQIPF